MRACPCPAEQSRLPGSAGSARRRRRRGQPHLPTPTPFSGNWESYARAWATPRNQRLLTLIIFIPRDLDNLAFSKC